MRPRIVVFTSEVEHFDAYLYIYNDYDKEPLYVDSIGAGKKMFHDLVSMCKEKGLPTDVYTEGNVTTTVYYFEEVEV